MRKSIKYLMITLAMFATITLFAFTYSMSEDMNSGLSEEDKMFYGFVNREGKLIGKKYDMLYCGVGGGGAGKGGIWLMSLSFHRYGLPLTEEEARKLIISCLDDFLTSVNKEEQIKPFLKNYPFTPENIDLGIVNYKADRQDVYHPYISTVAARRGRICFYTEEESRPFTYKSKKYETYEEAIAILQQEMK